MALFGLICQMEIKMEVFNGLWFLSNRKVVNRLCLIFILFFIFFLFIYYFFFLHFFWGWGLFFYLDFFPQPKKILLCGKKNLFFVLFCNSTILLHE